MKKLTLSRETLRSLSTDDLAFVAGGTGDAGAPPPPPPKGRSAGTECSRCWAPGSAVLCVQNPSASIVINPNPMSRH